MIDWFIHFGGREREREREKYLWVLVKYVFKHLTMNIDYRFKYTDNENPWIVNYRLVTDFDACPVHSPFDASKSQHACIILSKFTCQSKYTVINLIHTQHKRTF